MAMKRAKTRRIIPLLGTLGAMVMICYGAALAYLAYESRRASDLLRDLSSVKLGDNEASVVLLTRKYEFFRDVPPPGSRLTLATGARLNYEFAYFFGSIPYSSIKMILIGAGSTA